MKARASLLSICSLLVSLTLVTAGCNKSPKSGENAAPTSDQQVALDVQAKILGDNNVSNKQMTINANNGVVTLSGQVSSDAERAAAAADASAVGGVKTVVNNLTISSAAAQEPAKVDTPQVPPTVAHNYRNQRARSRSSNSAQQNAASSNNGSTAASSNGVKDYSDTSNSGAATSSAPAMAAAPTTPPPPQKVTIPAGTTLSIRTNEGLASDRNQPGDSFTGTLSSDIMADDQVAIPAGTEVRGRVVSAAAAGHFEGKPELVLALNSISYGGHQYTIETDQWSRVGNSRGKNTAEKVGGGAAVGAILGGIFGGGKGAAIGAASGAGVGAGAQTVMKAQQVQLAPESELAFHLQNAITVTPGQAPPQRHRLEP